MKSTMTKTLKHALVLSALTLAGAAAWADDITMPDPVSVSTLSRAEVQAEVRQARANGSLLGGGELALPRTTLAHSTTPAVHQRVEMALRQGPSMTFANLYGAP